MDNASEANSSVNTFQFFDINHPLLVAIAAPSYGGGLLPAAANMHRNLQALHELLPAPRIALWVKEAEKLGRQVQQESLQFPVLTAVSEREKIHHVYTAVVSPVICPIASPRLQIVNAMMGIAICAAVSANGTVSEKFTRGWKTLRLACAQTGRRDKDWDLLAARLPILTVELEQVLGELSYVGARAFVVELIRMLNVTVAPVEASQTSPSTDTQAIDPNTDAYVDEDEEFAEGPVTVDSLAYPELGTDIDILSSAEPGAFITWLQKRAFFARYPDKMGLLTGSDRLPSEELRTVCRGLSEAFTDASPEKRVFASVAICSLMTALPVRAVLMLPIHHNNDMYLDISLNCIIWNFEQLRRRNVPTEPNQEQPIAHDGFTPMYIPSPRALEHIWKEYENKYPAAKNLGELFGVPTDPEELKHFIYRYGEFLRSHGDTAFPAYSGRSAQSLFPVYLKITEQDIMAALFGFGVPAAAPGMLHYAAVSRGQVERSVSGVYEYLGLEPASALPVNFQGSGSSYAPSREVMQQGLSDLAADMNRQAEHVAEAKNDVEFLQAFNELSLLSLTAFITLTAHRSQRLGRLTMGALYSNAEFVYLADKDLVDSPRSRLVPKTTVLVTILDTHLLNLRHLAQEALRSNWQSSALETLADGHMLYKTAAFCKFELKTAKDGRDKLVRNLFVKSDVQAVTQRYFGKPANCGRHFWVTELCRNNASRWNLRVLTGHSRQDAEPLHEFGMVAPRAAMLSLKADMEDILVPMELSAPKPLPLPRGLAHQKVAFQALPLPSDRGLGRDRRPRADGGHVIHTHETFRASTPAAIHIIDTARGTLINGVQDVGSGGGLLLLLAVVDGVTEINDLRQIFTKPSDALLQVDGKPLLCIKRVESGQELAVPLLPPTRFYLKATDLDVKTLNWQEAIEEARTWLTQAVPNVNWPNSPERCISALLACTSHWTRYRLPPATVTAHSPEIPAATFSRPSILRLAGPDTEEAELDFPPWAPTTPNLAHERNQSFQNVLKLLNKWADTTRKLGDNKARAEGLRKDLENLGRLASGSSADVFRRSLAHEIKKIQDAAADALELSSLATYASKLKTSLESVPAFMSLDEYLPDDWQNFHLQCTRQPSTQNNENLTKKQKESLKDDRFSAAKRFLKTLSEIGFAIPQELLGHSRTSRSPHQRKAAASVFISQKDIQVLLAESDRAFANWPLHRARAELKIKLLTDVPLRFAESSSLSVDCVTPSSGHLVVSEQGFSVLKNRSSRRLAPLSDPTKELVLRLANQLQLSNAKSGFLFLEQDNIIDLASDEWLHHFLTDVLQVVTGDTTARMHSLRGRAFNESIFPGWEKLARDLIAGTAGPVLCRSMLEPSPYRWICFAQTSMHAGHGSRYTGAAYYWSSWPLIRAAGLCATLQDLHLPPASAQKIGFSDAALRQARRRHLATNTSAFDGWAWIGERCKFEQWDPFQATGHVHLPVATSGRTATASQQEIPLSNAVKYCASRIIGVTRDVVQSRYLLPSSLALSLDANLPPANEVSTLRRRVKGHDEGRAMSADIKALDGVDAAIFLSDRGAGALKTDDLFLKLLAGTPFPDLSVWDSKDSCQKILDACLESLPTHLGLELVFGSKYFESSIAAHLDKTSRLVVARPQRDIGRTPRVFVIHAVEAKRNAVTKARLTSLIRLLLRSFQCVNSSNIKGEK